MQSLTTFTTLMSTKKPTRSWLQVVRAVVHESGTCSELKYQCPTFLRHTRMTIEWYTHRTYSQCQASMEWGNILFFLLNSFIFSSNYYLFSEFTTFWMDWSVDLRVIGEQPNGFHSCVAAYNVLHNGTHSECEQRMRMACTIACVCRTHAKCMSWILLLMIITRRLFISISWPKTAVKIFEQVHWHWQWLILFLFTLE